MLSPHWEEQRKALPGFLGKGFTWAPREVQSSWLRQLILDCSYLSFGQRASVCLSHPISSPLLFCVTSPSWLASKGIIFSQMCKGLYIAISNPSSSSLLPSLHFIFAGEVSAIHTVLLGEKKSDWMKQTKTEVTLLFSFHFLCLK